MSEHKVNKFILEIENTDDDNCRIYIKAEPPIPEDCEELADTPNVVMVEAIMDYLNDEFGDGEWSNPMQNGGGLH